MSSGIYNLVIERGRNFQRIITWTDENEEVLPLSSYLPQFIMSEYPDGDIIYEAELEVVDDEIVLVILPSVSTLFPRRKCVYELFLKNEDDIDDVVALLTGQVTIK